MKSPDGQAAKPAKPAAGGARRAVGRLLRATGMLIFALIMVIVVGLGALAYRLDRGPLQIPYLASRLATLVSGAGITVHIDRAALAWAGYRQGGGAPLYLQLGGITVGNAKNVTLATVPQARLLFPPRILFGFAAPVDVGGQGARLAGFDAPVSVAAVLRFGFGFSLRKGDLSVRLGPGRLGLAAVSLPISGGLCLLHLRPADLLLQSCRLVLTPRGASAPVAVLDGAAHRNGDWRGQLNVALDKVATADLAYYWPADLASGTRQWVVNNLSDGFAHGASFNFALRAPPDLGTAELTDVKGVFQAEALTLRWLPGATPITGLNGSLAVTDLDTVVIAETGAALGELAISGGKMTITGVSKPDQIGVVNVVVAGEVADAVAVLNAPPLALLGQAPAQLRQATGMVRAEVTATLPLKNQLKLAQVQLAVKAALSNLAAPTPLGPATGGTVALQASTTQLNLTGQTQLAGEPASLAARVVYDARPTLRHMELRTVLGPAFLKTYGLDAGTAATDAVGGTVPVVLKVDAAADDEDDATVDADLTPARLGVPVLGWQKRAGEAGSLHARVVLDDTGAPIAVPSLAARGPQLDVQSEMHGEVLHFSRLIVGRTVATGDVTFPGPSGAPWRIVFSGPSLDVRAILSPQQSGAASTAAARAAPAPGAEAPSGPRWTARLRFNAFTMAAPPAPALDDLAFDGSGAGDEVLSVDATAESPTDASFPDSSPAGASQNGGPVTLLIGPAPQPRHRALDLRAGDGGALLRVLGAYNDVRGGALDLAASYGGGGPFAGTATLTRFQLLHAPALGKILQGLTIYGAPEAAATPGLAFSRMVAPFSIAHQVLTLAEARAYSASLGFTASGTIGLADGAADLNATVIPAYALNALPGKIPVIGKLFTAETGGGLFAVRLKITGPLVDPHIRVNPFSALTPGVLRDVFGTPAAK